MRSQSRELGNKMPGTFTVAAVGDLIQSQPFTGYANPATQRLIDVMRAADVTVANLECIVVDQNEYRGPGGDIVAPKEVADDMVALGVDMVTKANNHAFDMGEEGLWECLRQAERAGLVHCGAGRTLAEARTPRYFQSGKGLVGMSGVYVVTGKRHPWSAAVPSVNTMMVDAAITLTDEQFVALQGVRDTWRGRRQETPHPRTLEDADPDTLTLFDQRFRREESSGEYRHTIDPEDKRSVLLSFTTGKQLSDYFIATFHWHQNRFAFQNYTFDHYPADYQREFARESIDAGADAVFGHGVHTIKGIEIYKGRPICYGLSNFIFQQQVAPYSWTDAGKTRPWGDLNAERFGWLSGHHNLEALLVTARYEDGELDELRVYPVDLGPERVGSRLGIPELAAGEVAERILSDVQEYSRPFGTEILVRDGVGIIRLR